MTEAHRAAVPAWWRRESFQEQTVRAVTHLFLVIAGLILMIPFLWVISTSLKQDYEVYVTPIRWIPRSPVWGNYIRVFAENPLGTFLLNSTKVVLGCLIGDVLVVSLIAYGFARLRAPGRDVLFLIVLSTMMLPRQVTLVPTYVLFKHLGWVDQLRALIVPNLLGGSAFYIFLMRQFFQTITLELDDAAKIDGCSLLGVYWRIVLPLSRPVLGIVAVFSFLGHWQAFLWPLILLNSWHKYTIAIGLRFFQSMSRTDYPGLMAATLITVLPCIVLFFFTQRYFIQGIVFTGVKG